MVPFYGQGMNCGFEDVVVFFELLDKIGFDNLDSLLNAYSEQRVPDAFAICDLAVANYEEVYFSIILFVKKKKFIFYKKNMRFLVTTTGYKLRKKLDNFLVSFIDLESLCELLLFY